VEDTRGVLGEFSAKLELALPKEVFIIWRLLVSLVPSWLFEYGLRLLPSSRDLELTPLLNTCMDSRSDIEGLLPLRLKVSMEAFFSRNSLSFSATLCSLSLTLAS